MSVKRKDDKNRWRNKTVAFRVSPEENDLINTQVALSGLSKQDYIVKRLLCKDIVVQPNPRVYKALKDKLDEVLVELRRISDSGGDNGDLLETIQIINTTLYGMK